MRGEARFGHDHVRRVLGVMKGSSTRGQRRRCLPRRCATFEQTVGLDMTRGSLEAGGALIKMAVDTDVAKLSTLEASFMVMEVVTSKGCVVVAASPPDFSVSDSNFFFCDQRGQ